MRLCPLPPEVRQVGGLDVHYGSEKAWASIVVVNLPDFSVEGSYSIWSPIEEPYVPGLLAMREGPISLRIMEKMFPAPDVLLVDANGILHPRRCGLASMLGVAFDLPTVGVTKNPGAFQWEMPPPGRGEWTPIRLGADKVGAALRTRDGVKPVFVSPGHRADLLSSIDLVLKLSLTRIPEPLRRAHRTAGKMHQLLG